MRYILDACKVAGWGQTENPDNRSPKTLFETNMTYVDTPACAQGMYPFFFQIQESFLKIAYLFVILHLIYVLDFSLDIATTK